MRRALGILFRIGLVATYPLLVYGAVVYGEARLLAALVLILGASAWLRARSAGDPLVVVPPMVAATLGIAAAISGDPRALMAVPVGVNLILFAAFFRTMWEERSMIERYAELLTDAPLPEPRRRHCRQFTGIWSSFLALNALLTAGLAWFGSPALWALHTGVGAYAGMALLFAVEWIVRELRFPGSGREVAERVRTMMTGPRTGGGA